MKKTKAAILANTFLLSNTFKKSILDCRRELGIPLDGFKDKTSSDVWYNTVLPKNFKQKTQIIYNLLRDIRNNFPVAKPLFKNSFVHLLLRFLTTNRESVFYSIDVSGCNLHFLWGKQRKNKEKVKSELEDGIYIQIGSYTSQSDLIKFINKKWHLIEWERNEFKKENGLPIKIGRIRQHTNTVRDEIIWDLSKFPKKVLKEMSGLTGLPSNYRDMNIATLMSYNSEHKVTSDNVRKIISNQKKLRK